MPLFTQSSPYSRRAESFRQIRTNLLAGQPENQKCALVLTSAIPNEGKTSTSVNLALALGASGLRTIIVDADLRRPQTSQFLNSENEHAGLGLTDFLLDDEKFRLLENLLSNGTFELPNQEIHFMTSGEVPINPGELLNSPRMEKVITSLKKNFDYVIFDTPPVIPVADAAVLAAKCDGVIILCRAGKTRFPQFSGAVANIIAAGGTIRGVILNFIPNSRKSEEYGYKYGYAQQGRYGYSYLGSYLPIKEPYAPAKYRGSSIRSRIAQSAANLKSSLESGALLSTPKFKSTFTRKTKGDGVAVDPWDESKNVIFDLSIESKTFGFELQKDLTTSTSGKRTSTSGKRTSTSGKRTSTSGKRTSTSGKRNAKK
jgi:capsular exopolysaccharide synthesis family protein